MISQAIRLALFALLVPTFGQGQTVRGRIIAEGEGRQVPQAHVSVLGTASDSVIATQLSADGSFVLTLAEAGSYRLRIEALGYTTLLTYPVPVGNNAIVTLEVRMRVDAIALEPLQVVAQRIEPPFMREVRQRQRMGFGRLLTREELDQRFGSALEDVLRDAGLWVEYVPHGIRQVPLVRGRESAERAFSALPCYSALYVNGIRQFPTATYPTGAKRRNPDGTFEFDEVALDRTSELFDFRPQDVEAIEIYRDRNETPGLWADRTFDCGVVAIWLRSGYEEAFVREPQIAPPLPIVLTPSATAYRHSGAHAPEAGIALEAASAWNVAGSLALGVRLGGGVHALAPETTAALLRGKDPTLYDVAPGQRPMTLLQLAIEPQLEVMPESRLIPTAALRLTAARRSFAVTRASFPSRQHSFQSFGIGAGVALGVKLRATGKVGLHTSVGHDWIRFSSYNDLDTVAKRTSASWKAIVIQFGLFVRS